VILFLFASPSILPSIWHISHDDKWNSLALLFFLVWARWKVKKPQLICCYSCATWNANEREKRLELDGQFVCMHVDYSIFQGEKAYSPCSEYILLSNQNHNRRIIYDVFATYFNSSIYKQVHIIRIWVKRVEEKAAAQRFHGYFLWHLRVWP